MASRDEHICLPSETTQELSEVKSSVLRRSLCKRSSTLGGRSYKLEPGRTACVQDAERPPVALCEIRTSERELWLPQVDHEYARVEREGA